MTNPSNVHVDDREENAVVAVLDVIDIELGLPIREFLEQHGCIVFVNEKTNKKSVYHVIYGDEAFVKRIISPYDIEHEKTFIILSGESAQTAHDFSQKKIGKIALVGVNPLSSRQVKDLFAFFFTSRKHVEIFEETPHENDRDQWEEEKKSSGRLLRSFGDEDRLRIAETITSIFHGEKRIDHPAIIKRRVLSKTKVLLLALFFFVSPLLLYLGSWAAAAGFIYYGSRKLVTGHADAAATTAVVAYQWTDRARRTLSLLAFPFQLIGVTHWYRGQERMLSFLRHMADALESGAILVSSGKDTIAAILSPLGVSTTIMSPAIASDQLKQELLALGGALGLAQSELDLILREHIFPFNFTALIKKGDTGSAALSRLRTLVGELEGFISLYPAIAGFAEKKTYLVLLQNSMELRPTGGFIGSVATLTLSEGKLMDFSIQDVYALDGQLKGHVAPPDPIRDLLQQEHWYLRDSNWDPDFPVSAQRAAWFYEKESGNSVDGVIAVNVGFLTDILAAVGPVDLSDYNDRISAENFFGKSLFYTQANFFPGSTQKKDFLGAVTRALLTKVTGSKTIRPSLLRAVAGALRSGNFLLWFTDSQSQRVVLQLGWAGNVPAGNQCRGVETSACLADRTMLVEANLSVNKVNYFLKRDIRHHVVFAEDGTVIETAMVTITNNSPTDDQTGGGTYRTYSRLMLPSDTVVTSVTIDGIAVSELNRRDKTVNLPYRDSEATDAGWVVGVAYDVERGSEKKLVITYRRDMQLTFINNIATYDLVIQKQPGSIHTDFTLDITFPIFWQAEAKWRGTDIIGKQVFLANQTKLEYNTPFRESKQFTIRFQK